jgi:hypothetical protein
VRVARLRFLCGGFATWGLFLFGYLGLWPHWLRLKAVPPATASPSFAFGSGSPIRLRTCPSCYSFLCCDEVTARINSALAQLALAKEKAGGAFQEAVKAEASDKDALDNANSAEKEMALARLNLANAIRAAENLRVDLLSATSLDFKAGNTLERLAELRSTISGNSF